MRLDEFVFAALTDDAAVGAIISDRCYPRKLPQSPTLPAITYSIITEVPTEANTQLSDCRIQLDCWAMTYTGSRALAVAAKNALRYYRRSDGGNTVLSIYEANQQDDDDDERQIYRQIVDVIAMYHESE